MYIQITYRHIPFRSALFTNYLVVIYCSLSLQKSVFLPGLHLTVHPSFFVLCVLTYLILLFSSCCVKMYLQKTLYMSNLVIFQVFVDSEKIPLFYTNPCIDIFFFVQEYLQIISSLFIVDRPKQIRYYLDHLVSISRCIVYFSPVSFFFLSNR